MVQRQGTPYWVAARIVAAARGLALRRIAGQYALNTGLDFADLPIRQWVDAVESWVWDHFTTDDQVKEWEAYLARPHHSVLDADFHLILGRGAVQVGRELLARGKTPGLTIDAVPAGWDDATLLAESLEANAAG